MTPPTQRPANRRTGERKFKMTTQAEIQTKLAQTTTKTCATHGTYETGPHILARISDFYFKFPFARLADASSVLGYTQSFISAIKNSDSFKSYHIPRVKDKLQNKAIHVLKLEDRLSSVVETAIEKLQARLDLDDEAYPIPLKEVVNIVDLGLKRLGYGETGAAGAKAAVNVNIALVDKKSLEDAREKMHLAHGRETPPKITATDVLTVELDGELIEDNWRNDKESGNGA